jgi:hypothetical protein
MTAPLVGVPRLWCGYRVRRHLVPELQRRCPLLAGSVYSGTRLLFPCIRSVAARCRRIGRAAGCTRQAAPSSDSCSCAPGVVVADHVLFAGTCSARRRTR